MMREVVRTRHGRSAKEGRKGDVVGTGKAMVRGDGSVRGIDCEARPMAGNVGEAR